MSILWKKVLFIAPHTDDVELGCGGTIARMLEENVEVYVSVFSTAEESLPPGSSPNLLRDEFLEAMRLYGIPQSSLTIRNYKVRKLSYSRQEVLEDLVRQRKDIKPEAVFIPSGNDLHQDHQVIHSEGLRAYKDMTILGYELPWNHVTFSAQAFITLHSRHIEKKCEVLSAYRSQADLGRLYLSKDFILGLAKVRGAQVRAEYAEAFELERLRL